MPIGRAVLEGKKRQASGLRDRLVTILMLTDSDGVDASGAPTEDTGSDWTTLDTEWMARRDLRADEHFTAGQESSYGQTQWHMVYRADMDPELVDVPKLRRLQYEGRNYDVITAVLIDRRRGIELITLATP